LSIQLERLKKYLERDKTGMRREILKILLDKKEVTSEYLYAQIGGKYRKTKRSFAAILGLLVVRLGMLKRNEKSGLICYSLKQDFRDVVKEVLKRYEYDEEHSDDKIKRLWN